MLKIQHPWSSDFVMSSISATVEQRDLHFRPENQLIKPITLLKGNWSNKITLLALKCYSTRWDVQLTMADILTKWTAVSTKVWSHYLAKCRAGIIRHRHRHRHRRFDTKLRNVLRKSRISHQREPLDFYLAFWTTTKVFCGSNFEHGTW